MHASDSGHGSIKSPATARTFSASRRTRGGHELLLFWNGGSKRHPPASQEDRTDINIDERTVIVSGLSVVAHIDRVDDVNILFGMESTAPGDIGIMGGIDHITGDAVVSDVHER